MTRLAIISSHPIQYYAPWFRELAKTPGLQVRVFYLWDFGVRERVDPGFKQVLTWDIDLLSGYDHEFVRNYSPRPGTDRFLGLLNPGLGRALAKFRPDVLLVYGYSQASLLWLCLSTRYPFLLRGDSHALAGPPTSSGVKARLRRRALHRAAGHLAVGQANRDWLTMQGIRPERIFRAPHAIDQERFRSAVAADPKRRARLRAELGIAENDIVFGFVGKLEQKKQPLLLLQAFQQAGLDHCQLLFAGSGALSDAINTAASEDSRIHRIAFANQSEMPFVYAAMDVLVLPSAGAHETWGLVVNEAQALGKPVMVSNQVGCHVDLVLPGETGFVFEAGNLQSLVTALRDAANQRDQLATLGQAGLRRAGQYRFADATRGLLSALDQVRAT